MSRSALAAGLRHLRGVVAAQHRREENDEQLLRAFAERHDDSAFAALVRRHGPMVLGVCRRVLRHQQDAEDAFQATFLVLARNAHALRKKTALASFLHGTAYRVAWKAKRAAGRRHKHEGRVPAPSPVNPSDELSWREVRTLLDEEISRLPGKYRSVFVLCCLERVGRAEAARRLRLKEGTVSSRLAEARKRLQRRLARRGVELTALLAATTLTPETASALPTVLLSNTIGGAVSPAIAALVDSSPALLGVGKIKLAAVLVLAASVLTGAGLWAYRNPSSPLAQPTEPPAAKASDKAKGAPPKGAAAKMVEIQGHVLGPDDKPKAGAKLLLLSSKSKITPVGVSTENGRFTIVVPEETMKHWGHWLIAQADATGFDFLDLYQFKNEKPVELRLVKDNAIRGRVVNTEGKPIRGVRVIAEEIEVYGNNSLDTFRVAWMKLWAGGSRTGLAKQIGSGAGALFATTTDADGRFALRGMGAERTMRLRLRRPGIADTSVWVANRAGLDPKPFNKAVLDHVNDIHENHLNYRWAILSGPDVSVVAEAEKVIRGVVTDADTGKGQRGIIVRVMRYSDEFVHFPPEGKTDAEGRYEIHGVCKTKRYLLAIDSNPATAYMASQVWADDTTGYQPVTADLKVKKGVIVTGKMIDRATGEAIPGAVMVAVLRGNPFVKDYPKFDAMINTPWESSDSTDGQSAFRVVIIPGPVLLMAKPQGMSRFVYKSTGPDPKYPQYFSKENFSGNGDFYSHNSMWPLQGIYNKVLEIKPDVAVVKQDIVLEHENILAVVKIQDGEGRPLTGTWAETNHTKSGVSFAPHGGRLEGSSCSVYGEATGKQLRMVFYQADRKLAGTRMLNGDEKQPVAVKLGPAGAIKGRLLDADGKPLAKMEITVRYHDRAAERIHHDITVYERGQIVTDANGAFTFDDVIPELSFELSFRRGRQDFARQTKPADPAIQVKPGECRDLGAIKLTQAPEKRGE
ncbi:MAG TPA: sigma-70 family RNA polymerase sigma factor [Gemmataceae bacterium]|jgi:RNA polymerase sigma factor (sigma-70 family)